MSKKKPIVSTEADVALSVIKYLQDMGWEVHQEVMCHHTDSRADIVALGPRLKSGLRLLWVIEVKKTFTLDVIGQALAWRQRGYSHIVSVAIPGLKRGRFGRTNERGRGMGYQICRSKGIGVLEVYQGERDDEATVTCEVNPAINRRARTDMFLRHMNEKTLTGDTLFAAAGTSSRYWTPFKATCQAIRNALKKGPLDTRTLVNSIEHHYSSDRSARSTIYARIMDGTIPGCEW